MAYSRNFKEMKLLKQLNEAQHNYKLARNEYLNKRNAKNRNKVRSAIQYLKAARYCANELSNYAN